MFIFNAYEVANFAVGGFKALQKPAEFMALLECVEAHSPKVIVEIGVGNGGSSWAFSKLKGLEKLIAIDLPEGSWGGQPSDVQKEAFQYIANCSKAEVSLISGNSQNSECLENLKKVLGGREIDFLFIDGDHSYEGVKTDFMTYSPLVREGGLIGFHDICLHPEESGCEVKKFWDEIKASGIPEERFSEFVQEPVNWGGIGLVKW